MLTTFWSKNNVKLNFVSLIRSDIISDSDDVVMEFQRFFCYNLNFVEMSFLRNDN